jgi:hypothetical protein
LKFREVPDKAKLTILFPAEIEQALRDRAHRERRSLSDVASELVAVGLGRKPRWATESPSRKPEPATA